MVSTSHVMWVMCEWPPMPAEISQVSELASVLLLMDTFSSNSVLVFFSVLVLMVIQYHCL